MVGWHILGRDGPHGYFAMIMLFSKAQRLQLLNVALPNFNHDEPRLALKPYGSSYDSLRTDCVIKRPKGRIVVMSPTSELEQSAQSSNSLSEQRLITQQGEFTDAVQRHESTNYQLELRLEQ
eukprot:6485727-Amphidinium_carterae.1